MSDYLDPNNEELLKDFFAEAFSQVETLEQSILVLENDTGNKDAVDEIFRAAHTLKGGAGTVQMTELAQFTHLVEDVLDGIRSGKALVNEDVIDSLLAGIDVIKAMLDARNQGSVYDEDISAVKDKLARFLPDGSKAHPKAAPVAAPAKVAAAQPLATSSVASTPAAAGLSEYEILELREAAGADRKIYRLILTFNSENIMSTVSAIHAFAALRDLGTVLKTVPDFEKLYEDAFYPKVEYFIATDRAEDSLRQKAMIPEVVDSVEITEITVGQADAIDRPAVAPPVQPVSALATGVAASAAPPVAEAKPAATEAVPEKAEEVIEAFHKEAHPDVRKSSMQQGSVLRVDSRRIDNLLNLVSETVINKATFNQISTRFGDLMTQLQHSQGSFRDGLKELFEELPEMLEAIHTGRSAKEIKKEIVEKYGGLYASFDGFESNLKNDVAKFRSTAQNLGRITGELQEGVMRIRMVPISQIFSRFPRLVRDLTKSLNKKVNLVIEGEDTELDKSVIEDLLDPLMHAVRNGLDHGVEMPEERRAAGKNEEGIILLKASNEGNMIIIEIADDGKGIDIDAVRAKAVERGLVARGPGVPGQFHGREVGGARLVRRGDDAPDVRDAVHGVDVLGPEGEAGGAAEDGRGGDGADGGRVAAGEEGGADVGGIRHQAVDVLLVGDAVEGVVDLGALARTAGGAADGAARVGEGVAEGLVGQDAGQQVLREAHRAAVGEERVGAGAGAGDDDARGLGREAGGQVGAPQRGDEGAGAAEVEDHVDGHGVGGLEGVEPVVELRGGEAFAAVQQQRVVGAGADEVERQPVGGVGHAPAQDGVAQAGQGRCGGDVAAAVAVGVLAGLRGEVADVVMVEQAQAEGDVRQAREVVGGGPGGAVGRAAGHEDQPVVVADLRDEALPRRGDVAPGVLHVVLDAVGAGRGEAVVRDGVVALGGVVGQVELRQVGDGVIGVVAVARRDDQAPGALDRVGGGHAADPERGGGRVGEDLVAADG
ncbi:MAG: chemotaxis protein CheA, partial [Spirochaetota bacterium]